MNDKDKKAYDEWLDKQGYWYDSWNGELMQDGYIVSVYGETEAAWQAALEYARSEGPEDSIHEQGGVTRNMTWKESSEMMDRMAESLGKELKEWKEIVRSKVQMVNEEKERSKILVEALEKISGNWSDDYRYDASKALRKYRGEE
jgi:hypothetical protein